jgi:hyperosmotically inducible protein
MRSPVFKAVVALLLVAVFASGCESVTGRSAGRVIDDTTITASVKAKLVGEKAANFTRIGVNTTNGEVHLDGVVDSVAEKVRAEEIARQVKGVLRVVNGLQITGTPAASPGSTR